jgi:hypothetical protein
MRLTAQDVSRLNQLRDTTEIAVNEPRGTSAGSHRGGVDDRDQDGHTEIGIHEGPGCLVAFVEVGLPAESKMNWHEH